MATPPPELCSLGQGWGESTLAWLLPLSKPTSFPTFWSATHSQNDLNSQPTSWSISRKTQHATVALVPALVPLSKDIIFENCNIKFYLPFINLQLIHLGSLHSKKKSTYNAEDLGSISGLGRSLGEGNGNPFQYSCLENPMDRGAWQAIVHGVSESDTTEWLTRSYCKSSAEPPSMEFENTDCEGRQIWLRITAIWPEQSDFNLFHLSSSICKLKIIIILSPTVLLTRWNNI